MHDTCQCYKPDLFHILSNRFYSADIGIGLFLQNMRCVFFQEEYAVTCTSNWENLPDGKVDGQSPPGHRMFRTLTFTYVRRCE